MVSSVPTILLTGSTGVIGSAIDRHLQALPQVRVRRLVRDMRTAVAGDANGDLRDFASVRRAMAGVDVVVHAATYTGSESALAWEVNDTGTRVLVEAAQAAGVHRIVSLSTAAVYGEGPHINLREGHLRPLPVSEVSRSRLAGEAHVTNAGGYVLRPNFVSGTGDRAFIPGLVRLFRALGAWVDHGTARISTIGRGDLAGLAVAFALHPPGTGSRVFHANHPTPVTIRELLTAVEERFRIPVPARSITYGEALAAAADPSFPFTTRQFSLVTRDHTYDSTHVWQATGLYPGPQFPEDQASANWYATHLPHPAPL